MEKTNWIEKIKEAVHIAMNKGLKIEIYSNEKMNQIDILREEINAFDSIIISIYITNDIIRLTTKHGYTLIKHSITDREKLEIDSLKLSIKEYNEDMAISEFEEFISNKEEKEKITDIDNLDDDD